MVGRGLCCFYFFFLRGCSTVSFFLLGVGCSVFFNSFIYCVMLNGFLMFLFVLFLFL